MVNLIFPSSSVTLLSSNHVFTSLKNIGNLSLVPSYFVGGGTHALSFFSVMALVIAPATSVIMACFQRSASRKLMLVTCCKDRPLGLVSIGAFWGDSNICAEEALHIGSSSQ